nr:uncharacterized protein LOC109167503 [Ipomoea batatas]
MVVTDHPSLCNELLPWLSSSPGYGNFPALIEMRPISLSSFGLNNGPPFLSPFSSSICQVLNDFSIAKPVQNQVPAAEECGLTCFGFLKSLANPCNWGGAGQGFLGELRQMLRDENRLIDSYAALDINDPGGLDLDFDDEPTDTVNHHLALVGRLITEKIVKFPFMRDTMASVWRHRMGVAAKDLSNNIFLFQFFHELDVLRVLNDGPWSFEQSLLVLARAQPNIPPPVTPLDTADFWIQIHELPLGFFSEKSAAAIGNFIGEYL